LYFYSDRDTLLKMFAKDINARNSEREKLLKELSKEERERENEAVRKQRQSGKMGAYKIARSEKSPLKKRTPEDDEKTVEEAPRKRSSPKQQRRSPKERISLNQRRSPKERSSPKQKQQRQSLKDKCFRDMSCIFANGEKIVHEYKQAGNWTGTYNKNKNVIVHNGTEYLTPTAFALAHIRETNPDRPAVNGWDFCMVQRNGKWEKINKLPCTYCPGRD